MLWSADLSCIAGDGGGHESLQIAAETDALHRDDGLLGEHGPAGTSADTQHYTSGTRRTSNSPLMSSLNTFRSESVRSLTSPGPLGAVGKQAARPQTPC